MDIISSSIANFRKFGFAYTFFLALRKARLVKELPVSMLVRRQAYYASLSLAEQKKHLALQYKRIIGKVPDFDKPNLFTEKLQWLKFYDSTPKKAQLSDKYLAPRLVQEKYGSRIRTIPQLGAWERAEDIDFSALPKQFVLKCNHGSAMNIIVRDKVRLNKKRVCKKLNGWLKIDYAYVNGLYEMQYSPINRKIIAEQFISELDGNLHDYKIHCFMGEPKYIQFIGDRVPNTHDYYVTFYTPEWEKTDIRLVGKPYDRDFEKPARLNDMLSLARDMSKDFSYVRVDFYCIGGEIYFGELTFTPDSGIVQFNKEGLDALWGSWIKL